MNDVPDCNIMETKSARDSIKSRDGEAADSFIVSG